MKIMNKSVLSYKIDTVIVDFKNYISFSLSMI